ncbi:MAG: putative DNA modification/repair radical SAM protein [Treponemataceae bacterium]
MDTAEKIGILADAAKYDASCSTSGSARENTAGGIGNNAVAGICHSWSADGRCVSLLKVLLSNACAYDCAYCVNRRSNDIRRASFEPDELVRLIIDFYKRNYIEGAFLSSGVVGSPDATMERLIAVARTLRERERFNGYLHLKAIPGASDALVTEAARWADRVSVNIELPSALSLSRVAPDKTPASIFGPMRALARASGFEPRRLIGAGPIAAPTLSPDSGTRQSRSLLPLPVPNTSDTTVIANAWPGIPRTEPTAVEPRPLYDGTIDQSINRPSVREARQNRYRNPLAAVLPAGQTTQLVVGASPESDAAILTLAENLYLAYDVRRVYYSAFIPVGGDPRVPSLPGPPLLREHRLYQADWLFRFYGFTASEILENGRPFLDDTLDPKCDWALRNIGLFPIDVNKASYLELLRVPGIGPKAASRVLRSRRSGPLKNENLQALGVVMKRARWFVCCSGKLPDTRGGFHRLREPTDERALRALLSDGAASLAVTRQVPTQYAFDWSDAPWSDAPRSDAS